MARPFTFFFHVARGRVPAFEIFQCEDEQDARTRAAQLLIERPDVEMVEVTDGLATLSIDRHQPGL